MWTSQIQVWTAPLAGGQQRSSKVWLIISHHTRARNESWCDKTVKKRRGTGKRDNLRKDEWGKIYTCWSDCLQLVNMYITPLASFTLYIMALQNRSFSLGFLLLTHPALALKHTHYRSLDMKPVPFKKGAFHGAQNSLLWLYQTSWRHLKAGSTKLLNSKAPSVFLYAFHRI